MHWPEYVSLVVVVLLHGCVWQWWRERGNANKLARPTMQGWTQPLAGRERQIVVKGTIGLPATCLNCGYEWTSTIPDLDDTDIIITKARTQCPKCGEIQGKLQGKP